MLAGIERNGKWSGDTSQRCLQAEDCETSKPAFLLFSLLSLHRAMTVVLSWLHTKRQYESPTIKAIASTSSRRKDERAGAADIVVRCSIAIVCLPSKGRKKNGFLVSRWVKRNAQNR